MAEVEAGRVTEEHINRAVRRVLLQKCELGLRDPDWQPEPEGDEIDLDPAEHRDLARRLAEQSIVLLENPADALPLNGSERIAVAGPPADRSDALLGCHSIPAPVGAITPTFLKA